MCLAGAAPVADRTPNGPKPSLPSPALVTLGRASLARSKKSAINQTDCLLMPQNQRNLCYR